MEEESLNLNDSSCVELGSKVKSRSTLRSQGGGSDGGDRGDGATSVTGLKVNVICEAVEVILRVQ